MATYANNTRQTPVSGFQFEVHTVANEAGFNFIPLNTVGFTTVSGLSDETDSFEYKDGNDLYGDTLPGMTKPGQITLARGSDLSNYLEIWRAAVRERTQLPPQQYRCDVIISMYDRRGTPEAFGADQPTGRQLVKQWVAKDAWPKSLSSGDLQPGSDAHVQTLVLCMYGPLEPSFPILA